jgi:putative endonuclease
MSNSISSSEYGRAAETAAAWLLRFRGLRIVGRNVRVSGREVDLVARRGRLLVVCEVKARRHGGRGGAVEAVDARKRRRLREAVELLAQRDPDVEEIRFDVVTVNGLRIRHVRDAFS